MSNPTHPALFITTEHGSIPNPAATSEPSSNTEEQAISAPELRELVDRADKVIRQGKRKAKAKTEQPDTEPDQQPTTDEDTTVATKKTEPERTADPKREGEYGVTRSRDLPWCPKKVAVFKALKVLGATSAAKAVTTATVANEAKGVTPRDVRHYVYHAKAAGLTDVIQGEGGNSYRFCLTAKGAKLDPDAELAKQQATEQPKAEPKGEKSTKGKDEHDELTQDILKLMKAGKQYTSRDVVVGLGRTPGAKEGDPVIRRLKKLEAEGLVQQANNEGGKGYAWVKVGKAKGSKKAD